MGYCNAQSAMKRGVGKGVGRCGNGDITIEEFQLENVQQPGVCTPHISKAQPILQLYVYTDLYALCSRNPHNISVILSG